MKAFVRLYFYYRACGRRRLASIREAARALREPIL
jgi:hypothetical protein